MASSTIMKKLRKCGGNFRVRRLLRGSLGKLASMLEELSEEKFTLENLQRTGLIAFAVEITKLGEFEQVKEDKETLRDFRAP